VNCPVVNIECHFILLDPSQLPGLIIGLCFCDCVWSEYLGIFCVTLYYYLSSRIYFGISCFEEWCFR